MGPMGGGPKQPGAAPSSQPMEQNHQPASKPAAPGPQQPAPPSQPQASAPGTKAQDGPSSVGLDSKSVPGGSPLDGGSQEAHPAGSTSEGNPPPAPGPGGYPGMELPPKGPEGQLTPQQQQQQQLPPELMGLGENTEGLSQEQLEHRERSLQTLRDIQRMLFPDDKDMPGMVPQGGNMGGPPPNPMMEGPVGGPKKPEQGPLQAMMAQSQSLGKPGGPRPDGPPFGPPGPRDMGFPPDELGPPPPGPPMGPPGGMGGEPGDHMTPEQLAWLKLQQEFYEEKKRKQEMMMHGPHGPRMMRGPPPPYQMNPSDGWGGPGGPEPFPDQMGMGGPPPPRGMHPHMQRFPGMMNPEMDGGHHMPRPGMNWPEGDGRGFPQGMFGGPGGPGGRVERFPNPQAVQEAMFQQGMGDKPGMMMDMNRMMGNPRHMEPGPGGMMFPRMPGDGPMSPSSRMEFVKGLSRDMGDFGMGPGNMGMGPNPQMMNPKMGMSPEEMMKMRGGGGPMPENMGHQQKMMQGPPFPDQPHPGDFNMGPNRQFPHMNQPPGHMGPAGRGQRGEPPFGPDHRPGPGPGGNGRLSHMVPNQPPTSSAPPPPPPNPRGGGRKQVQEPVGSPGVNPLKSPPLRQVQSPMLASPSAGLKSPQTPSQLAGILTGTAPTSISGPTAPGAASIKSPAVMGSAGASPVHMKSPSVPAPSPGWTSSPKPPLQSPGAPQGGKPNLNITSPNMMSSSEPGGCGSLMLRTMGVVGL